MDPLMNEAEEYALPPGYDDMNLRDLFLTRQRLYVTVMRYYRALPLVPPGLGPRLRRPFLRAMMGMQARGLVPLGHPLGHAIVGEVDKLVVGDAFLYRTQLRALSVHSELNRGITHALYEGGVVASSVVSSGRCADDQDPLGQTILYAGEGGYHVRRERINMPGHHVENQGDNHSNAAMIRAYQLRTPVRVVRNHGRVRFPPDMPPWLEGRVGQVISALFDPNPVEVMSRTCYSYHGLYRVTYHEYIIGVGGRGVYLFTLRRIRGQAPLETRALELPTHETRGMTTEHGESQEGVAT